MHTINASELNLLLQDIDRTIRQYAPSLGSVSKELLKNTVLFINSKGYYSLIATLKSPAVKNFLYEHILTVKIDGRKRGAKIIIEFTERKIPELKKSFQSKIKFKWNDYKKFNKFTEIPMHKAIGDVFKMYFDRDILKRE